jgi:hypothetical protein
MATPRTKAQKQFSTIERAQFNLKRSLDRLDYEEEVIHPGLKKIAEIEAEGKTVNFNVVLEPLQITAGDDA